MNTLPAPQALNGVAFQPLLTTEQAALYLNVCPNTLEKARTAGRHTPPYAKMGKTVRYRLADLEAFVANSMRANTTKAAA